jgi:hypothetical protein
MVLQFLMMPSARQKVRGVLGRVRLLACIRASDVLVRCERIRVYLDAHRARRVLARSHLVQAEHFARRVVELVMVDLDIR